jgi:hypothetical protein
MTSSEGIELPERRRDDGETVIDDLKEDIRTTGKLLRKAVANEEAHFQGEGQWDAVNNKPKTIVATPIYNKGKDWTHEEKQTLRVAQAAISIGSVSTIAIGLTAWFRVESTQEAHRAATARSAAELATAGNVTTVNQELENSAYNAFRAQITDSVNQLIVALGAIVAGVYEVHMVNSRHAENVEKLNRPDVTKIREGLQLRLDRLHQQLAAEIERYNERRQAQLPILSGSGSSTDK